MKITSFPFLAVLAMLAGLGSNLMAENAENKNPAKGNATERITAGGGCFWCVEAVFQRIPGVLSVKSGYAGGHVNNPTYDEVCEGTTGHAEVVQIEFDPAKVTFAHLMQVFWAAHDPTSVLKADTYKGGKLWPKGTAIQGADAGPQYRSIVLFESEAQRETAEASKKEAQKEFKDPIVTEIVPLKKFYVAEKYHQNYYNLNKDRNPYCAVVITPKLQKLLQKGVLKE